MNPLIGAALISTGGGILSSLMGRDSGAAQNQAAYFNYLEQQRANKERERLAREQLKYSTAPVVSATGTRSGYNPATGAFTTELSPRDQILLNLQQDALARQLGPEQQRAEVMAQNAFDRSMDTNNLAEMLFDEVNDPNLFSADEAYGSAMRTHTAETNRLMDDAMTPILAAMRARGDNPTGMLAKAAGERAAALRQGAPTRFDARVDATNLNQGMRNDRINRAMQVGGAVRNPGAAVPNLPGLNDSLNTSVNNRAAAAGGAQAAMAGFNPAQMTGVQTDNTDALRVGSISNALGGLVEALAQNKQSSSGPSRHLGNTAVNNDAFRGGYNDVFGTPSLGF